MDKPLPATATVHCVCGQVAVEGIGAPIASVICYCDDCQEGARQIRSLPNAVSIEDPDGGTAYLVYRKDRVTYLKGTSLFARLQALTIVPARASTFCGYVASWAGLELDHNLLA
jgi:hypothetical protein